MRRRRGWRPGTRAIGVGNAKVSDLLGDLGRILALRHELRHLRPRQPHLQPHRPILHRGLPDGQIGDSATREHEALKPLLRADVQCAGPSPARNSLVRQPWEFYQKVELFRFQELVRRERSGADAELPNFFRLEERVTGVVTEHVAGGGCSLEADGGAIDLHDLCGLPLGSNGVPHARRR